MDYAAQYSKPYRRKPGTKRRKIPTANTINNKRAIPQNSSLIRFQRWVEENNAAALKLSLKSAAAIACLEPCHFSKVFHRSVGISFKQWRLHRRISWATQALRDGSHSINDVVALSGYRNRRAFERAFARLTGTTPGELHRKSGGLELENFFWNFVIHKTSRTNDK